MVFDHLLLNSVLLALPLQKKLLDLLPRVKEKAKASDPKEHKNSRKETLSYLKLVLSVSRTKLAIKP